MPKGVVIATLVECEEEPENTSPGRSDDECALRRDIAALYFSRPFEGKYQKGRTPSPTSVTADVITTSPGCGDDECAIQESGNIVIRRPIHQSGAGSERDCTRWRHRRGNWQRRPTVEQPVIAPVSQPNLGQPGDHR